MLLGGAPLSAQTLDDSSPHRYRLAEDWSDAVWKLQPGHYAHAADLDSSPNGWITVLDRQQQALHRVNALGEARAAHALGALFGPEGWEARRVDGGADNRIYVLALREDESRVLALDFSAGEAVPPRASLVLEAAVRYNDLAVEASGDLYLSRSIPRLASTTPPRERVPTSKGGVDRYAADGSFLEELDPDPLYIPVGLDVGPDGRIYVLNRVPSPDSGQGPGPVPTPEPSRIELAAAPDARFGFRPPAAPDSPRDDPPDPVYGVVVFAPDRSWERSLPFNAAEDVAAGPAGVFIARQVEIFRLGEPAPLYSGPNGQVIWPYSGGAVLHLTVPQHGPALVASLAHCYTQGILSFAETASPPGLGTAPAPRFSGAIDRPPLEGPAYPLRIAVGSEAFVLQGRFDRRLDDFGAPAYFSGEDAIGPQSVQRWSSEGRLMGQAGLCGGLVLPWLVDVAEPWWTRDLAALGEAFYSLDAGTLQARPDPNFPAWSWWPPFEALDAPPLSPSNPAPDTAPDPARLVAVDARDDRIALLDAGRGELFLLDPGGATLARWSISSSQATAPETATPAAASSERASPLPVDLAIGSDRLFIADAAGRRILPRAFDGSQLPDWPLHDVPKAVATGPDGSLFALGHGGWVWRYDPAGRLLAYWRLPETAEGQDLSVLPDGSVLVPYSSMRRLNAGFERPRRELLDAGIWRFVPAPDLPLPAIAPAACAALPDKSAAPASLLLGGEVSVALTVDGHCPGQQVPFELALVIDTSRSMGWESALERAKAAAQAILTGLDPATARVSLIRFDSQGAQLLPLGKDFAAISRAIDRLEPDGDTRMAPGLDLALESFTPGNAAMPRSVIVLTDIEYKDGISSSVRAIVDAGIGLDFLVYPVSSFDASMALNLERLIGRPGSVHVAPEPASLAALIADRSGYQPQTGLFESILVTDILPANMRYVLGSAQPQADWDPLARSLSWRLPTVLAAEGLRLTFRVEPLEVGYWPTNVEAHADYRDALGHDDHLRFPLPRVHVVDPSMLAHRIYLPLTAARDCLRSAQPLDLLLLVDSSLSMAESGGAGRSKLEAAAAAAAGLVRQLTPGRDRVAVIGFDDEARPAIGFAEPGDAVLAALAGLQPRPGTRIDRGLEAAAAAFATEGRLRARPALILLSDGRHAGEIAPLLAAAADLEGRGVRRLTIALGESADLALLEMLATSERDAYRSASAEDLAAIYAELAGKVACDGG